MKTSIELDYDDLLHLVCEKYECSALEVEVCVVTDVTTRHPHEQIDPANIVIKICRGQVQPVHRPRH